MTVAASPALIARAREIADEIQQTLVEELTADAVGDPELLAAFLIAGYTTVLTGTARRLMAGDTPDDVAEDHRARVERLFEKLRKAG